MLSAADSLADVQDDLQSRKFSYRTRSASMSSPSTPAESYEYQNAFMGHTGPLRNERRTQLVQMSGPLYVSRVKENVFLSTQGALGHMTSEPTIERYPSSNVMGQNDWIDNSYTGKNEHLLKSGQLGMCNDPYCTTCPTYYKPYDQRKKPKSSDFLDYKVIYFTFQGYLIRSILSLEGGKVKIHHNTSSSHDTNFTCDLNTFSVSVESGSY